MAYNDSTDTGALDESQSAAGPQNAAPEGDESHDEQSYTCFLPGDFPGAENLKAGDVLTLKVVGKDKDGDIEVQHMPEGEGNQKSAEGKGMMDHFDREVGQR